MIWAVKEIVSKSNGCIPAMVDLLFTPYHGNRHSAGLDEDYPPTPNRCPFLKTTMLRASLVAEKYATSRKSWYQSTGNGLSAFYQNRSRSQAAHIGCNATTLLISIYAVLSLSVFLPVWLQACRGAPSGSVHRSTQA